MWYLLYIVGFIVLITGLAMGAHLLNVPREWIGVGIVILAGIAILTGASLFRRPNPHGPH
jgi:hypothetical protein